MARLGGMKMYAAVSAVTIVAAYSMGASPGWAVLAGFAAPAVIVVGFRFLLGTIDGARDGSITSRRLDAIDQMSGTQFEDYVAQVVRSCGLAVIMTPTTGDWGVDLIVGDRPNRVAVQCKRHTRPIGPGAVQQVVAGAPMHGCTKSMVVSNQEFTAAAHTLAEPHDCILVGGSTLAQLGATIRQLHRTTDGLR